MRKSRFAEEQIIKVLKEHAAGLSAGELCRKYGISLASRSTLIALARDIDGYQNGVRRHMLQVGPSRASPKR